MTTGSMSSARLPVGRGTRPGARCGADPRSGATTCAEGPAAAAPLRGEGGLKGESKRRGGTELQGPPTPPPSRLHGAGQPPPTADPTSSSAWRCWCDLCLLGSPKGESSKHREPSQHRARPVQAPRPTEGLQVLQTCSCKGCESRVPAGPSCWCLHTPASVWSTSSPAPLPPKAGHVPKQLCGSGPWALGNSELHSTGKNLWRLCLCRDTQETSQRAPEQPALCHRS